MSHFEGQEQITPVIFYLLNIIDNIRQSLKQFSKHNRNSLWLIVFPMKEMEEEAADTQRRGSALNLLSDIEGAAGMVAEYTLSVCMVVVEEKRQS